MPLTALTLSDGAAGNLRQVRALAGALGAVSEERVLQPVAPWRWLAPRRLPGSTHAFGPGFAERLAGQSPDLAIGCGRQSALATRLLGERPGCRSVQILDPRLDPAHWDVIIAPVHDGLRGANVITTVGSLNPVDAQWLADARQAWPAFAALPAPRMLLLLGGPTRAVPFERSQWAALADVVDQWWRSAGGSLLVSSSRRSPDWLRHAARERFAGRPGRQWHGPADGENPYPGMLAWADRIVCTADSVNLLSEACATGVPVYGALPTRPSGRIAGFHRALLDSGRLRPLQPEFEPYDYAPLREAGRVAATLRARLGY